MKLSIANAGPKAPPEKTYEFSLVSEGNSVQVKVSINGQLPISVIAFETCPYKRDNKVHSVRYGVPTEHFITDDNDLRRN